MSEPKLGWDIGTVKLKNCPQCGHKTRRDFCTPQCRMEDSDNRIEGVEEERDELKRLFKLCVKDLYSSSGKFKKSTALEVLIYINKPSELGEDWYE